MRWLYPSLTPDSSLRLRFNRTAKPTRDNNGASTASMSLPLLVCRISLIGKTYVTVSGFIVIMQLMFSSVGCSLNNVAHV